MDLSEWLLVVSGLLALAVLLGALAERVRLPVTAVLTVVGVAASWLGGQFGVASPLQGEVFEEVVVFLFLPVLVFEAAYGLSTRAFVRNLAPILVLAIPAVLVAALFVGFALFWVLGVPLSAALLFGALICATDPVAVVAIFRELGVPSRLLTLVEGESLLNDGVAIVLFSILLAAALGDEVSALAGVWEFVSVFLGGAAIGTAVGLAAALALPWLEHLPAAALSVAVAYGGFVLADAVLGFSGVMATVAAGLVLSALAPSRASERVRASWRELWEALGYVANALLFLLIGLAIDPLLFGEHLGAVTLAVAVVLAARVAAVVPLVSVVERLAGVPPVGFRNEAVLIWGGLRGGVALALALPEELPQRELFVAMTGGVVLATLLLNATTVRTLVHRLGLDRPTRADRFLADGARLSGVRAAQRQLEALGLDEPAVVAALRAAEEAVRRELARIDLSADEELEVLTRRGLFVERDTYQRLSDAGLLPPSATRALLHEVDDQIEALGVGRVTLEGLYERPRPRLDRLWERLSGLLPSPLGDDPTELAYAEAAARRLAARRTVEALELFERLPNVRAETLERAQRTFVRWEEAAVAALDELDGRAAHDLMGVHRRQAEALCRVAAEDALRELADVGLLPAALAERTAEEVAARAEA
ncbi:cation:proton antiporter [Truepera radiovictrix]|uniref:Sodium/hydrogen exchanger n=1 Tax=Truepera radiovictrix (strain DSM 17093 / CIP 108686 / LMG 22925 / RQ-24) TaxID=649638 RepID=D7CRT2_TRURR|nr:sodium:proton antiporter [Truepera radiovictrix]ADI15260.1 sodium/hydrogen exchanger [Truepera radiovictrix DSM 17093]WMT56189.1 sodium:proton antiporter [Truepera radiovictrix]